MELHLHSAAQLRQLLAKGEICCEELTAHYLGRIARFGGKGALNAIACLDPNAMEQARAMDRAGDDGTKPLWGLPVLVKDNIDVEGLPTTAGSFALAGNIAKKDAPIVANLRKNGAIILGKTNMTEFANYTTKGMPNGFSSLGGQVVHAYDSACDPLGSSSGSGVAMSAGLCALAVGTDTSFSVIACATANGVTGLKPPAGTLSAEGIVPIAHTLDSAGPMTRTFEDALMLLSAMQDAPLPHIVPAEVSALRIAVNTSRQENVSGEQTECCRQLFDRLKAAGAQFGEVFEPPVPAMRDIMRCEFREDLEEYLEKADCSVRTLSQIVRMYRENPEQMPYGISLLEEALACSTGDEAYASAMRARAEMQQEVQKLLSPYDAVVMTGPTNIMHFLGLPSVALKMCKREQDSAPRGLILYGADEARLYCAALAIEKLCESVPPPAL
ncbi:MAG: amidase [Clostridia bacterium]|nr:amidase [Clostridia bacterium]